MAEVHVLPSRISTEGAQRLLIALRDEIASGHDLGPRAAQIRSLSASLENASQEMRSEVERLLVWLPIEDPRLSAVHAKILRLRDDLVHLADAFEKLGAATRLLDV